MGAEREVAKKRASTKDGESERAELERLLRENAELREENEILGRFAAFANKQKR
jgi:transposase-like protein